MAKAKKTLDDVLTKRSLTALAGRTIYGRGEGYFDAGAVSGLRLIRGRLRARVAGSDDYDVALWSDGGRLDYECSCPMGLGGDCCKHVVATALAWLDKRGNGGPGKINIEDKTQSLRNFLRQQSQETLVDWLLQQCDEDPALHHALQSRAARHGGALDIRELKSFVRKSLAVRDFVPYHRTREVLRRAQAVTALLEELLNDGYAAVTAELADYAMARGIKAYANLDDSSGLFGEFLTELGEWHLRAFASAGSAYPLKGKNFFKLKLLDDWGFFPFTDYAPLLSKKDYEEYCKLAEAQWEKVPAVTPEQGQRGANTFYENFLITSVMEELARHEKDIDRLVAIKSRALGSAYRFLEIAEILQTAKRGDEALAWAERGLAAFKNDYDGRLVAFTAAVYQKQGRRDDAVELVWRYFQQQPQLESYKALKAAAAKAGDWPARREKALEYLNALDRKRHGRSRWDFRQSGTSLLIDIFLWEKEAEAALATANKHGAREDQWLELAEACEKAHPEEAAGIYRGRLDDIVHRKNNDAYDHGAELTSKVRALMGKTGHKAEFNHWLEEVCIRHKAKRNFMQRLEPVKPFRIKK